MPQQERVNTSGSKAPKELASSEVLNQAPEVCEIERGVRSGILLESISFEKIFMTEDLMQKSRGELDPQKVKYLARSIKEEDIQIPRILMRARLVEGPGGLPGFRYEILHKPGFVEALKLLNVANCEAIVLYGMDDFSLENAQPKNLLVLSELGAKIDLESFVPTDKIIMEGMINDEQKEKRLTNEMGERGQEIRIWVRAREDAGVVVFDMIDGFHRTSALRKLKIKLAAAKVSYGMSDEELYDQRVAAATTQSVKFARVIKGMQQSFQESEWATKHNLKLSQILSIAAQEDKIAQPGKNLGFTPEESGRAIAWAKKKVAVWRKDIGTTYLQIKAAESSFEEIIDQVRSVAGGGHKGSGILNAVKFYALAEELPNDLHLQGVMLGIIKKHNLNSKETRMVAKALRLQRRAPSTRRALQRDPINAAEEVLKRFELDTETGLIKSLKEGQTLPRKRLNRRNNRSRLRGAYVKDEEEGNSSVLRDVNFQQVISKLSEDKAPLAWLEETPNISEIEKLVVAMLFREGVLEEDVCQKLGITFDRMDQLLHSAQRKYALHLDDLRLVRQFNHFPQEAP